MSVICCLVLGGLEPIPNIVFLCHFFVQNCHLCSLLKIAICTQVFCEVLRLFCDIFFAQNSHMYTSIMVKSETNILIAITIVFLLEFAFEGDNSLLFLCCAAICFESSDIILRTIC